jgi:hypothetical protein
MPVSGDDLSSNYDMVDAEDVYDPHSLDNPENIETELINLREETAKRVNKEGMLLGDYLLKALDIKYQSRIVQANTKSEEALKVARHANSVAAQAEKKVDDLRSDVTTLQATVTEQGKLIAELQVKLSDSGKHAPAPTGVVKILVDDEQASPASRLQALNARYTEMVNKAEIHPRPQEGSLPGDASGCSGSHEALLSWCEVPGDEARHGGVCSCLCSQRRGC